MRKLFHYGTIFNRNGRPCPILWISSGYDTGLRRPYLNVMLFGHFMGRLIAKEIRYES